ncbi:DUF1648 domain-containing protein [Actinoplanes sp. NPDC051494]|uniref:DUF1648 domain-containing protein n=1 Tax=Actinoplanes sp. NPDC051494 TaxID=3363907 RepID=UPI00378E13A5
MRRLWTAVALVWLPVVVLGVAWPAWSGRLPSRIATHWGGSGQADGFSSATGFGVTLLLVAVAAAVAATVAVPVTRNGAAARFWLTTAGTTAGGAAGTGAAATLAALADPADPRLGWRIGLLLAGVAWGFVVLAAAGRPPRPEPAPAVAVDVLDLGPTERAAYLTTLSSPLLAGVTLAAGIVVAVVAATVAPVLWPVLVLPVAAGVVFGRLRVSADRRGLRVVAGLAGIPVKRVALDDIASAEAAEIRPSQWGGWGYRVTPGASALVLRGGPGLVLVLRDGRRFAVTLDDPATPAALLNALLARSPGR